MESLGTAKIKAVRKALLNIELNIINEFQEKHGLEDYSLQELAEYLIDNGDCGLKADITDTLEKEFIKFADKHSLWYNPNIVKRVNESTNDFLMDCWEDIWDDILNCDYIENVMYVVTEEMEGTKWERNMNFDICSTWSKAVESFNESKENAIDSMNGRCDADEINVEVDNVSHFLTEANYYEYWYEVMIEKKEVR